MDLIVFEDAHVARLRPAALARPAYAISCGSYRLIDWLRTLQRPIRGIVRPHLARLQEVDFPDLLADVPQPGQPVVLVNARLVPSRTNAQAIRELLRIGRPGVARVRNEIALAVVHPDAAPRPAQLKSERFADYLGSSLLGGLSHLENAFTLFSYPHDLVRFHMDCLDENLAYRIASGEYREIRDGVFAADGATLGEHIVTATGDGPIVLDRGAKIGPYSYLCGPVYLGPNVRVLEHASIKDEVAVGHTSKIGGEVEASVIEPYTNKQHHGFLGHSYLGSWINLGAGTCNSDLKNTYGLVNMDYHGEKVATGMQFVGCIMGDYAKTAINTGIFTGKSIGVCSMMYGFVTTNVPSFVNYARLFGQVTELPPEVMIQTQQRMFSRRNVSQRPCDVQLIHDMYELTRDERQIVGEPLSL